MDYKFHLSYNGIRTEIEEPVDWDDIETTLKREKVHGVAFEVALGGLGFYGVAKQIILSAISKSGLNANIIFEAEWRCVTNKYENFYTGRLSVVNGFDFSDDVVSCVVEPIDAIVLFNNRIDQKVDVLSDKSIGGVTIDKAKEYAIKINGQQLRYATKGVVDVGGWAYNDLLTAAVDSEVEYGDGTSSRHGFIYPLWNNTSTDLGNLSSSIGYDKDGSAVTFNVIGQLFDNPNIKLFGNRVKVKYRVKGRLTGNFVSSPNGIVEFREGWGYNYDTTVPVPDSLFKIAAGAIDFSNGIEFDKAREFYVTPGNTNTPTIRLAIFYSIRNPYDGLINIEFDEESFVEFTCVTDLINGKDESEKDIKHSFAKGIYTIDALRAITAMITDRKLGFASNLSADALVSNMLFSTGKYIRNGRNADSSIPPIQTSFKELYNALDSVACLGLGMDKGSIVVNPWRYFYQSSKSVDLGDVNSIKRTIDNDMIASAIKIGYAKYSTEGQSGAEDPFTDRDYVTSLESGKNALEKVCKYIASGYVVEECRRVAIKADNNGYKYDEDLFFLVCKPSVTETAPALSYSGASGNTLINSAITPFKNAKRWAPFCAIVKLGSTSDKRILTFTAGTGNTQAVVEGLSESGNLDLDDIEVLDAAVLPSPYLDSFDAPLSKLEYETIKANPYASVGYGGMVGWIKSLKYKMSKGEASFQVYPSLATFASLYQVDCQKIKPILPEEKPDTDIVFIERFDKWSAGLPSGWSRQTENGSLFDSIEGGGALLHGQSTNFEIYKKVIALPAGVYTVNMEVFELFKADPFDGISLVTGSRNIDQTSTHRMPAQMKYTFTHTGEIEHIKLQFLSARNKGFNIKLKSITIKKSV
jgi:hypothetical protein